MFDRLFGGLEVPPILAFRLVQRIAQGARPRESTGPSPRQRTTAAMSRDKNDSGKKDNGLEYEVRGYGEENEDERSDNDLESNDESDQTQPQIFLFPCKWCTRLGSSS